MRLCLAFLAVLAAFWRFASGRCYFREIEARPVETHCGGGCHQGRGLEGSDDAASRTLPPSVRGLGAKCY